MDSLRKNADKFTLDSVDLSQFLRLNSEARIMVRKIPKRILDEKTGTFVEEDTANLPSYPLALNFRGDICYVIGNNKMLIVEQTSERIITPCGLEGFELTPESIALIMTPFEGADVDPNDPVRRRIDETRELYCKKAAQAAMAPIKRWNR